MRTKQEFLHLTQRKGKFGIFKGNNINQEGDQYRVQRGKCNILWIEKLVYDNIFQIQKVSIFIVHRKCQSKKYPMTMKGIYINIHKEPYLLFTMKIINKITSPCRNTRMHRRKSLFLRKIFPKSFASIHPHFDMNFHCKEIETS